MVEMDEASPGTTQHLLFLDLGKGTPLLPATPMPVPPKEQAA